MDGDGIDPQAAFEALRRASGARDAFDLAERHPVLLSGEFAQYIEDLLGDVGQHEGAVQDALAARDLIDAVRAARVALAVEATFDHCVPDEAMDLVADLLRCPDYDVMAGVVTERSSAVDEATRFLTTLMVDAVARGDHVTTSRYYPYWEFLHDCRFFGADAAFETRARFGTVVETELASILHEVAGTPGPDPEQPLAEAVRDWDAMAVQAPHPVSALLSAGVVGPILRSGMRTGALEPFSEALRRLDSALAQLPPGHRFAPPLRGLRATVHLRRYEVTGDPDDLRTATAEMVGAAHDVMVFAPQWPLLAQTADGMTAYLLTRDPEREWFDALIRLRRVIAWAAADPSARTQAKALHDVALIQRQLLYGGSSPSHTVLDELMLTADTDATDPEAAWALGQQGNMRLDRYADTGSPDDLAAAITTLEAAVRIAEDESPAQAVALDLLGWALRQDYMGSGADSQLDRAVDLTRRAHDILLDLPGHPAQLGAANFANVLIDRYRRDADPADLDEAVRALEEDLRDFTDDPSPRDRAATRSALAIALAVRYQRWGDIGALSRAIELAEDVAGHTPDGPSALTNLAELLITRFHRTRRPSDLNRAIDLLETAVQKQNASDPMAAARLGNLAQAVAVRSHMFPGDRARAHRLLATAASAATPGTDTGLRLRTGLATIQAQRALAFGALRRRRRRWADQAVSLITAVLDETPHHAPERAVRLHTLAVALMARHQLNGRPADEAAAVEAFRAACETGLTELSTVMTQITDVWSDWAARRGAWREAAEACDYSLRARYRLAAVQTARSHKELWIGDTGELLATAAHGYATAGDAEAAVAAVERGRAVILSERLGRAPDTLASLPAGLARRYRQAADAWASQARFADASGVGLDDPGRTTAVDGVVAAKARLDAVVDEIRQVDGFARFLMPPDYKEVAAVASLARPVVYLVPGQSTGLALVVDDRARVIWLPALRRDRVVRLAVDRQALDETLRWAWHAAMGPVLEAVPSARHLVIVACGALGLLPLHAAWTQHGDRRVYVLDRVSVSFAPNARSVRVTTRTRSGGALVVANPLPSTAAPLPFSGAEAEGVAGVHPGALVLDERDATLAAVREAMADRELIHFACHGVAEPEDPLASALLLAHDERLTLREVLSSSMDTGLAVLSACETALPGRRLPDEVIGFPAGLLEAGADAVIATLWRVDDNATMMLMRRMTQLRVQDGEPPAEALRKAQQWLRDSTNEEKVATLGLPLPPLGGAAARLLWGRARVHAHPYYWAGFTCTGG
ncbi:CHAT domain-containing protein [Streptomyces massasporeus]|uniref:CHAT domain-containing tetratricopeptide repeat protein n=1 Tax=Streptomyces massasporeus TaxID=67324 RepID=UPI0036CDB4BA